MLLIVSGSVIAQKVSNLMIFSLAGFDAHFLTSFIGTYLVTGTHMSLALFLRSFAAIAVLTLFMGRPSVTTRTTELASFRPKASSDFAAISAAEVRVVERGHVKPFTTSSALVMSVVKCCTI